MGDRDLAAVRARLLASRSARTIMHGMNTSEPPAVAIEGVSHSYGARQALDNVNVSIAPSTFAVLLGLNGAGKSTLFSLLTRLYAV